MKSRQPPLVLYPLLALLVFVFLHSLMPFDPRIRMGIKTFEPELGVSPAEIWYAVKKWRHILWFAIFFPLVRTLFTTRATAKAIGVLFLVTFLIEFEECFVAGRHGRVVDLLPNLIGSAIGATLWTLWHKRRGKAS